MSITTVQDDLLLGAQDLMDWIGALLCLVGYPVSKSGQCCREGVGEDRLIQQ